MALRKNLILRSAQRARLEGRTRFIQLETETLPEGIMVSASQDDRFAMRRRDLLALAALGLASGVPRQAAAAPQGQLAWGAHISLAPTWLDPAETSGIITPFMVLYALHDAMVKPMPGQTLAASLAESWSASEEGLSYDFALRQGTKFHNGEPVTAEDVKFSFER